MAEPMWTILEVGPFNKAKKPAVDALIEATLNQWQFEGSEPVTTESEDGIRIKAEIGSVSFGAAALFGDDGKIPELIDLGVPYVLWDTGKDGVRPGLDYSWHPSFGSTVRVGERSTGEHKVFASHMLTKLQPLSNEELGRAIRAYFAEAGTPAADAGWPIWDEGYESPATRTERVRIDAEHRFSGPTVGPDNKIKPETVDLVMRAVEADEPAIHMVGSVDGGYVCYGPYQDSEVAIDVHEPELEEILTIFDRDVDPEDALRREDVTLTNYGALWCWGNFIEGYGARGIYRDVAAAIEANDGQDGFVVAMTGPLE